MRKKERFTKYNNNNNDNDDDDDTKTRGQEEEDDLSDAISEEDDYSSKCSASTRTDDLSYYEKMSDVMTGREGNLSYPHKTSQMDEERRRKRRERNKMAAARCRQRRIDLTNLLTKETECLENKRNELEKEVNFLNQETNQLQFILDSHSKRFCRMKENQTQTQTQTLYNDINDESAVDLSNVKTYQTIQFNKNFTETKFEFGRELCSDDFKKTKFLFGGGMRPKSLLSNLLSQEEIKYLD